MTSTTPLAPRLLKGALVVTDQGGAAPKTIVFQYNPEKVTRTLRPQLSGGQGQRAEAVHFTGAPEETFSLDVIIDATDQLESGDRTTLESGIYPQLSALELLLYPSSQQVMDDNALLDQGKIEIGGSLYNVPLTLFVWGSKRVLPVTVTSVTVTEEEFDTHLNPIRATVALGLRALSYSDLDSSNKAYNLFLTYQKNKEQMAKRGYTGNANSLIGVNVNRLR